MPRSSEDRTRGIRRCTFGGLITAVVLRAVNYRAFSKGRCGPSSNLLIVPSLKVPAIFPGREQQRRRGRIARQIECPGNTLAEFAGDIFGYAGQMVHAVGPRQPGPIGTALGQSRWVDVNGDAESKWCPAEGEAVVGMLAALASAGVQDPDVFIITPFKVIEQEMRRRLDRETGLLRSLGVKADEWPRDRVGTIHTFQGREADTVILLLGAPKASQHRARQWAASPPNIINVAVSRAKQNLYVVGSATAWSAAGTSLQVLQRALAQSV